MRFRTLAGGSLALLFLMTASAVSAAPEVGEPAPEFVFEGAGRTFTSADYVGESARKKGVVVAWFPKAFTPG